MFRTYILLSSHLLSHLQIPPLILPPLLSWILWQKYNNTTTEYWFFPSFTCYTVVKMSTYAHVIYQCWADAQSMFQFWLVRSRSEPWLNFETGIKKKKNWWAGPGIRFAGLFQKFKQLISFPNPKLEIRVSFHIDKTNKYNFPKINPYKKYIIIIISWFTIVYYEIVIWFIVNFFIFIACNNYDDFLHLNFIIS